MALEAFFSAELVYGTVGTVSHLSLQCYDITIQQAIFCGKEGWFIFQYIFELTFCGLSELFALMFNLHRENVVQILGKSNQKSTPV